MSVSVPHFHLILLFASAYYPLHTLIILPHQNYSFLLHEKREKKIMQQKDFIARKLHVNIQSRCGGHKIH